MRWSQMLIPTLREVPKDAEATSHKLMLRAGLIRKLMAGVYSYLPIGFRVLQNVVSIVREEMDRSGAQELLMPAIHPAEIWKKTGRYDVMRDILMTINKDDKQEIVLGPTHEEIITEIVSAYIASYKDLPKTLYQIQSKFRDEARPRFGVIRSKEFIMKDAYSFDSSFEDLDKSYKIMYEAYKRIFDRCGLEYAIVSADVGDMGGDVSHEFMVKLPFGEDFIVSCSECDLFASLEVAETINKQTKAKGEMTELEEFATPNTSTIEELKDKYDLNPESLVKTLIYLIDNNPVACLVRGDHDICEPKLRKALNASTVILADEEVIKDVTGAPVGYAGPVNLNKPITIVADQSIKDLTNFITGANQKDMHYKNVNVGRDFNCKKFDDIRYVKNDDPCPVCNNGKLSLDRALEIGHVFKLGTKYSKSLHACFLDKQGKEKDIVMGCYGIGVNRILAACIELHNDEKGIKWPLSIAPFKVGIIIINQKDEKCVHFAEDLYSNLRKIGIETIYDDRDARAGVKFNDSELIGIPYIVVVGDRNMKNNNVELKSRFDGSSDLVSCDCIFDQLVKLCNENK